MRLQRIGSTSVLLLSLAVVAGAQDTGRAARAGEWMPRTVAEAEAAGSGYPRPLAGDPFQPRFREGKYGGTDQRRCVDVGTLNAVRSGEFLVMGFAGYRSTWMAGFGKLAWGPAYAAADTSPPLTMRATRLDGNPAPTVFVTKSYVHNGFPPSGFFNTGFHLPEPGRWLLLGTAGRNWGCFILTF